MRAGRDLDAPIPTTARNERTKLTAAWLNTAAGAALAVGVFGPLAAAYFGVASAGTTGVLRFTVGLALWLAIGATLHAAGRFVLRGLRP